MLTAYKRKRAQGFSPWYGFLILLVIAFAFGLKIIDVFKPTEVPTANVPAITYEDAVRQVDEQPTVSSPESQAADSAPNQLEVSEESSTPGAEPLDPDAGTQVVPSEILPEEFNLAVPFTSQAPTGNWDPVHEDTCEEASFLMVVEFYSGRAAGKMDPAYVDPKLLEMVAQQTASGLGYSISAQQSVDFIEQYYGLTAKILDNPTVDQIKQLIVAGKPVLVPAAGRKLGNPFFMGDGPLYHMLVLRGFTQDAFIANDPGTRNGENYSYTTQTIMDALGDWNNGDPNVGAKRIVYIEPR